MKLLAIETSCDETAIALLDIRSEGGSTSCTILASVVNSQVALHQEFGGVFPALAKREHQKNLPIVLQQVMSEQDRPDIICVTNGPGLEPALWTGIVFAQELGKEWNIPVIPVNHMEGHVLSVLIPHDLPRLAGSTFQLESVSFPAIALLISGGHTEIVLVRNVGSYEIIGRTRDDAVGEAFDKVARMMDLPYPGGPEIAKLASKHQKTKNAERFALPRPMIHSHDYDFSFSGLKTAVLYLIRDLKKNLGTEQLPTETLAAIAHEFQEASAEVLTTKTRKALHEFNAQTLIVGGGVAANTRIIESLKSMIAVNAPHITFLAPSRELTGDNAVMIGLAGYFKYKKNPDFVYNEIRADGNLEL